MRSNEAMRQMANTVGKIKGEVGELKDDVGEIKCPCSITCVGSVVKTESSSQGAKSKKMFINGFLPRTHP